VGNFAKVVLINLHVLFVQKARRLLINNASHVLILIAKIVRKTQNIVKNAIVVIIILKIKIVKNVAMDVINAIKKAVARKK
jgi:hypothetical protein